MVEEKDKVTEQKDGMMTAFYTCKMSSANCYLPSANFKLPTVNYYVINPNYIC